METSIFRSGEPPVIAGPCSAESRTRVLETARALKACGVGVFRAGLWKPRTRPGAFEGVGEEGLAWLGEVRSEGFRVATEVACSQHVDACLKAGVDILWIGARTTTNPFLVQQIADALRGVDIPVLVKNPVSADVALWEGAFERLSNAGVSRLIAVLRGFYSESEPVYRNSPGWNVVPWMRRRFPEMPLLCDPSHIAGRSDLVGAISREALDLGLDGLMVEVHCKPSEAMTDSAQQLSPEEFSALLPSLNPSNGDAEANSSISALRGRIDALDDVILRSLAERMEVSREIGRMKREGDVAIVQPKRWNEVLDKVGKRAVNLGLDTGFVSDVWNRIHEQSISEQNEKH